LFSHVISPTRTTTFCFFFARTSLRTLLPAPAAAFSLLRRLSDAFAHEATPYAGRSQRARRLDWKIAQTPRRRLGDALITLTLLVAFLNVFGHNGEIFYCTMKDFRGLLLILGTL
jgi:hypothetical protein